MTPETQIKHEIIQWLDINGWFHFPIRQGKHCYKGISDRIACKNGITLFIEIKSKSGKQTKEQIEFQHNIESKGCHYVLASGYEDIENYLRGLV